MLRMKWQRSIAASAVMGCLGVVVTGAAPAWAASGGPEDPPGMPPLLQFDAGSAIVNIAIFLIVLVVLSKFVWPVILNGLEQRDQKIRAELEGAHQANSDAKSLLASYQTQLAEASNQVQKMLADAKQSSEKERQRIVAEAREEAETHRKRTLADIDQAKKVAISELAEKTADMAISAARQIVSRELKADDHADLIRQSLEQLPSKN